MKKLFDIKRTKMIDELAFGHNPLAFGKSFLAFFLISIIVNVSTNMLTNTPILLNHILNLMVSGKFTDLTEALIEFLESPTLVLPWWYTPLQLLGGIFAIIAVTVYIKKFEKRKLSAVGLRKGGVILEILLGVAVGGALIGAIFASTLFSGAVSYAFVGFDIRILTYALGFLIFSFGEELLVRGFFMGVLARDMRPMTAIVISSILHALSAFSLYDATSITNIINTVLFGILLGVLVFKRGSIWSAVSLRFVWSFVGCSILGTNVFGSYPIISLLMPNFNPPVFLSGSRIYGFGAGLLMTALLAVAILLTLLLKTKKSEQSAVKIEYFN
jgi:membrane protease YdiL (CAAX protease family)